MASPIPTNDGLLLPWAQNFCLKFPIHSTTLTFGIAALTAAVADCNMLIYLLQTYVPVIRHDAEEAGAYKDLMKEGPIGTPSGAPPVATAMPVAPTTVAAGILPRLRLLVQEIKNKQTYNEGIGSDLGIIVAATAPNYDPPELKLKSNHAHNVVIPWTKGAWSGVKVQARSEGTGTWTDLGLDLFSPYVDTRPLLVPNTPEVREYRACHINGDTSLENWSSILVVNVIA